MHEKIDKRNYRAVVQEAFALACPPESFTIVHAVFDAAMFGNFVIVFRSAALDIQVVRDRSQYFADFASASDREEWIDQETVFALLGAEEETDVLIKADHRSLSALAAAVARQLGSIEAIFTPETFPATLQRANEYRKARAKRLFGYDDLKIRAETHADEDAIRRLNDVAFDGPVEGQIVDRLRIAAHPFISLVVEDDGEIVGHICFSPVEVERPDGTRVTVLGLAPMAVAPGRQKQGIGTQLIARGLNECRAAGFNVVVVIGHPEYYPRFGFVPAAPRGLRSEYDVPDPVFMLRELEPGAADALHGVARYHPAFSEAT